MSSSTENRSASPSSERPSKIRRTETSALPLVPEKQDIYNTWVETHLPGMTAAGLHRALCMRHGTMHVQVYNLHHVIAMARERGLEVLVVAIREFAGHDMQYVMFRPADPARKLDWFKEQITVMSSGQDRVEDLATRRWFLVARTFAKFTKAVTIVCKIASALDAVEDKLEMDFSDDIRPGDLRFVDIGVSKSGHMFYAMITGNFKEGGFAYNHRKTLLAGEILYANFGTRESLALLDPEDPALQGAEQFPMDHACPNCKRKLYTRQTGPAPTVPMDESDTCDECYDTEVEEGEPCHPRAYMPIAWEKIPNILAEMFQWVHRE
jgi:hypothetical protein